MNRFLLAFILLFAFKLCFSQIGSMDFETDIPSSVNARLASFERDGYLFLPRHKAQPKDSFKIKKPGYLATIRPVYIYRRNLQTGKFDIACANPVFTSSSVTNGIEIEPIIIQWNPDDIGTGIFPLDDEYFAVVTTLSFRAITGQFRYWQLINIYRFNNDPKYFPVLNVSEYLFMGNNYVVLGKEPERETYGKYRFKFRGNQWVEFSINKTEKGFETKWLTSQGDRMSGVQTGN
jgi:hypothetical protein